MDTRASAFLLIASFLKSKSADDMLKFYPVLLLSWIMANKLELFLLEIGKIKNIWPFFALISISPMKISFASTGKIDIEVFIRTAKHFLGLKMEVRQGF